MRLISEGSGGPDIRWSFASKMKCEIYDVAVISSEVDAYLSSFCLLRGSSFPHPRAGISGCSLDGQALALGARSRRFESCHSVHKTKLRSIIKEADIMTLKYGSFTIEYTLTKGNVHIVNSYNIRILSRIFTSSVTKSPLSEIRRTLKP